MTDHNNKMPLFHTAQGRLFYILIAFCLMLSGCHSSPLLAPPSPPRKSYESTIPKPEEALQTRYKNAIEDAKIAEPSEIITTLSPITHYNPTLNWADGRVLLSTWTDYEGYGSRLGQTITLHQEVWVTVPQVLKQTCHEWELNDATLDMRLRQLLGLPPDAPYTHVAELWVLPDDLFRPSADPEINDQEACIDFPQSERYIRISSAHKRWMYQTAAASYMDTGYPWTRLGYTYDWGNNETEVGLSEFVIRKGARVVIQSFASTNQFCAPEQGSDQ